ncbi:hypothetical protein IMSAGC013_01348 [Lachnospiraceae bacterium]|nr:hypothetical protein IMSAGC013_01348 [Lachnospiraceae bacterium]
MVIKFQEKQYELISKIKTTGSGAIDLYAAADAGAEAEGVKYTVACVNDMELARRLVPVTTRANVNYTFKDLHASFNADGKYYIIFSHAAGKTLQQAIERGNYHLQERLLLMKNVFAQIFLLNMPECFLYEILRKDNIVVDDALGIRFNYFFTEVDYYWKVQEKDCINRVSGLVQELFARELEQKSSRELMKFARDLEEGRFAYLWDCYVAYDNIYESVLVKSEQEELRPGRIWWRAWEWLKKAFPKIRAMLAAALILSAAVYLLLTLPNPVLSDKGITFRQIGTLEIQEQQE